MGTRVNGARRTLLDLDFEVDWRPGALIFERSLFMATQTRFGHRLAAILPEARARLDYKRNPTSPQAIPRYNARAEDGPGTDFRESEVAFGSSVDPIECPSKLVQP